MAAGCSPVTFRPTAPEALYLAVLAALAFLIQFLITPAVPSGPDATTYLAIAQEQLANSGFWSDPDSLVRNFWSVAYPTVLAGLMRVSGGSLGVVVLLQSVLTSTLVVIPWILTRRLPKLVQYVAPAVLVLTPGLWWMGTTIGYEATLAWLLGFSLAIAWIVFERGRSTSSTYRRLDIGLALVSGLLAAGALLTQSKVLVVLPVIGYLLFRGGRGPLVAGFTGLILGLLPWMIRNLLVLGTLNPLSNNGGYNLWVGNNPDAANGGSMLIAPPVPTGESMTSAAVKFIVSQPERWIELLWSKAGRLMQPVFVYPEQLPVGPARGLLHFYAGLLSVLIAIGVVAFLGAWLLGGRRRVLSVTPLGAFVALWFLVHLPFIAESRYMTSILPVTVTVSVSAWAWVFYRWRGSQSISADEAHAQVQSLERRGMPVSLDLSVPSWRSEEIVVDSTCIEQTSTLMVPAQECGLPEEQHSWPALFVRTLKDVLLDVDSGLVFAGDRVIAQSGSGTRASRDSAFVSGATFRLQEVTPTNLRGPIAPLGDVHHHYHFVMETLPRILHARAYRPDVTFVTSAVLAPKYLALLEAWGINLVVAVSGSVMKSSEVILVDQPQLFWPRRVDVDAVRSEFVRDNSPAAMDERIYVSRKNVSRSLRDEDVLQAALLELGVRSVVLEDLSFVEQVKLFRGTSLVVASHGAGLVGLAFMSQGARVIEVTSGEVFEECYRRLAAIRGLDYTCLQISGSIDAPQGEAGGVIEQLAPLGL